MEAQIKLGQQLGNKSSLHYGWLLIALVLGFLVASYFGAIPVNGDRGFIWGMPLIITASFFAVMSAHTLVTRLRRELQNEFVTEDNAMSQTFAHNYQSYNDLSGASLTSQNQTMRVLKQSDVKNISQQIAEGSELQNHTLSSFGETQITPSPRSANALKEQYRKERQALLAAQLSANANIRQRWMESNAIEISQLKRY